jgi:hypothetical protein
MRFIAQLFLFLFFFSRLSAQFSDDFSDGDFTSNPAWSGNNNEYLVTGLQLRSNSSIASSSFYLSTNSTLVNDAQWEFWCNLQFNTSSLNYVDVYLIADQSNLTATNLNGYFVRIGNTLDEVCLYKNMNGTSTKIIDGADGTTNASNNLLKVKLTRDVNNQFVLYVDYTGSGNNYILEGIVTDNTFLTSVAFGLVTKQSTSSFFQKHFFDDFYVGPIILDTVPPVLQSVLVTSAISLDVSFGEPLDLASCQSNLNYFVSNGVGNPVSSVLDAIDPKLVHLTFSSNFVNAISHSLTVTGVKDTSGNAILTPQTTTFTYVNLGVPVYKDVIINEIMADPNPSVGSLPLVEWVEILNVSNKTFDLNAWKFSDAASTATLGAKYLLPGQYMLLCKNADTSSLNVFGTTCGMSSMPSLNDGGDNLYLKDNAGNIIDSVNYSNSWYNDNTKSGGGWSLELINPFTSSGCAAAANWSACMYFNGATPCTQNSIYSTQPDITGPSPVQVSVTDSTHITLCFNENPDVIQSQVMSNYFINNGIGTPILCSLNTQNPSCVEMVLASPLQNATIYSLSVTNVNDCAGNPVSPGNITFSFYVPQFNDVVIHEIMADPDPAVGLPNYEYIELHNRTAFAVGLKNYVISTPTSSKFIPDVVIQPDSFLILCGSSAYQAYSSLFLPVAEVVGFPSLTNTGSTLTLKNSSGKVIHSVSYSDSWYQDASKAEGGFSLEMIDPTNPCGEENNWRASLSLSGGTPGNFNSVHVANPDVQTPELKRISVISVDTIQLFFSENTDSVSILSPNLYQIDQGIGSPIQVISVPTGFKSVKLVLASNLQVGIIYTCTLLQGIKDCAGNLLIAPANTARFSIPLPAAPGDVVINELMFDPKSGNVEFVELYNKSSKTIDISSLLLGEMDTISNVINDLEPIQTEGFLFFPGEYIVVSESGNLIKSVYYTPNPNGFVDISTLPSMNSEGDVVTLCTASSLVIDQVVYSSDQHFDLLNDTKGVSLERIDFDRSSADKTNWNSAASSVGFATPAYRNSQYLLSVINGSVNVEPEVFSPDNDGYHDVLNISYSLEKNGQVANVQIFDASGRLIRRLIKNETLGQEGTFSWNGLTDNGEKAPIGIYVIFFETFDAAGKVSSFKKSCVLASRL